MLYVTLKDRDEASRIGKDLVQNRLSACVNIIENSLSIYQWKGKICEDTEVILLAKTKSTLLQEAIKKIKTLHSYECPCIVSLPITGGFSPFLDWIKTQTR